MAENAVSGSAYRPGDIITHYDGTTSERNRSIRSSAPSMNSWPE